jgi:hypothetical protein
MMPESSLRLPYWTAERAARDSALVATIEARRGGRLLNLAVVAVYNMVARFLVALEE